MKDLVRDKGDAVLFRGQNRVWPTVTPSINRDGDQAMRAMWTICRRFVTNAAGVTGYSIPREHDRLAVLQHYVGRSPVVDLTGTPEVALYFALLGAERGRDCVVYSVDRTALNSSEVVVSDHSFLTLPFTDGGAQHRWLRQDGFSIGPSDWRDTERVRRFDLLQLPGVEFRRFPKGDDDEDLCRRQGNLEDVASDPLATAVRSAVISIARSLDLSTSIEGILRASKEIWSELVF